MDVLKNAVTKQFLTAAVVVLLQAVSGSFMTVRFDRITGYLDNSCDVIYNSIAPACFPGIFGGTGYTSSSTVVTMVGGTISSSLVSLVLPADQYPA